MLIKFMNESVINTDSAPEDKAIYENELKVSKWVWNIGRFQTEWW